MQSTFEFNMKCFFPQAIIFFPSIFMFNILTITWKQNYTHANLRVVKILEIIAAIRSESL